MKFKYITILLFIITCSITAQQYRIYGTIRDHDTGELLSNVSVSVTGSKAGAVSNSYGFFSIRLNSGEYFIEWSYLGYVSFSQTINLAEDISLDITLKQSSFELTEVSVQADYKKTSRAPGVDVAQLKMAEMRSIPAIFSEPDVFKSLQTLPGVMVSHHGSANMSVRGGSYSQNLVLLDEAPIYNPFHILGFMSSFNPDAVSSVNIYKGVPARYGKMLSSVVDVRMKEGNREHFSASGGIGLVSSRLSLEGPINGGKGSFLLAGRYCYAGFILKSASDLLNSLANMRNSVSSRTNLWFYDFNLKTNYTLNSRNRVFLSGYSGFDKFFFPHFSGEYLLQWGNKNGTLRWNHVVNPSLFVNTSLIVSQFGYSHFQMNRGLNYRWDASMGNIELKSEAEYSASDNLKIVFGVSASTYRFQPGDISPRSSADTTATSFSLGKKSSFESGLFFEIHWEPIPNLFFSGGIRLSSFANFGPGTVYVFDPVSHQLLDSSVYKRFRLMQNFVNLNPRASVSYTSGNSTFRASYTNMVQYLHKACNSTLGMPTDIWFPASKNTPPQLANQFSVGYSYEWSLEYVVSIEPYFKKMYRQTDFRDGADLFVNPYLASEIRSGSGRSKGIEVMIEKKTGKLTGRLSYTLSSTTFEIQGINNNLAYAVPYDSRHNFSASLAYVFNKRLSFASSFKYATGRPVTIPSGMFNYQGAAFLTYSERNGFRIEDFHQLDISITFKPKPKGKNYQGNWNLSILNVYNRKNTFNVLMNPHEIYSLAGPGSVNPQPVKKMYLYGIFPTVGYEFKF